jgi:hypothetical protein
MRWVSNVGDAGWLTMPLTGETGHMMQATDPTALLQKDFLKLQRVGTRRRAWSCFDPVAAHACRSTW